MRVYRDVKTVVELTEEQHERLKNLVKQAQAKDAGWTEKRALKFLSMIRCPDFWDIQLNLFEKAIIQD